MLKNFIKLTNTSLKQHSKFTCACRRSLITANPLCAVLEPFHSSSLVLGNPQLQSLRHKSKTPKKKQESDSEESDDITEEYSNRVSKVLTVNVTSPRVDAILKSALGIARNKIETMFYENKVRLNGEKLSKKSVSVQESDEIDLFKGPDPKNSNFIIVSRLEVISIKPEEESIAIKIRRYKSLTIEAY